MVKVLVPLDGSQEGFESLEAGLGLLKAAKPAVTLFCVYDPSFTDASEDMVEVFDEDEDDEIFPNESSAKRMLDAAAERCAKFGVKASTKCVGGKVRDQIVAESAEHDILLMPALGPSSFKEKLRLSHAEDVARNAQCSVLMVAT